MNSVSFIKKVRVEVMDKDLNDDDILGIVDFTLNELVIAPEMTLTFSLSGGTVTVTGDLF